MLFPRRLKPDEVESLKGVYGDELDTSKIRVRDNHWTSNLAGVGAFVFGNNIQISGKRVNNRSILIHEAAHCWQFQKTMGWNYLFSALLDHIRARFDGHNPYDYSGVVGVLPWEAWGVEQQAQWIQDNECLPPPEVRNPQMPSIV